MLYLNSDKIKEMESQLTYFRDFVPFRLLQFCDLNKRYTFLKSIGLYDKVLEKREYYRRLLDEADNPDLVMDKLIKSFIADNPQFKDFVIFE